MIIDNNYNTERLIISTFRKIHITDEYLSWFEDEKRLSYTDIKKNLSFNDALIYVNDNLLSASSLFLHISLKDSMLPIGTMRLSNFFSKTSSIILSLLIGKNKYSGNSFGKEIIDAGKLICKDLEKNKTIFASINVNNISSIISFLKSGFIINDISDDSDRNHNIVKQLHLTYQHENY